MLFVDNKDLPKGINNVLPNSGKDFFRKTANNSFERTNNEVLAMKVAWQLTKAKFRRQGNQLVALSSDFIEPVLFQFDLVPSGSELIVNEENGDITIDAVLADNKEFTNPSGQKRFFSIEDLQSLANQINEEGSTNPLTGHDEVYKLVMKYGYNYEAIKRELGKNRGFIKNIKAVVEKGKLWIRALLDKRYKNHIQKFKGVSLEAFSTPVGNRLTNPRHLGFIFTNNPRVEGAQIAS